MTYYDSCAIIEETKQKNKQGGYDMFKKFVQRIIEATDREDAIQNVFYGRDGIDIAFQDGKISWKEHEMLLALIEKLA